jgi:hypothetical protein
VALLLVKLGTKTAKVLCILRSLVTLTGGLLASSFLVIETATVQLAPSLHVLVLRL